MIIFNPKEHSFSSLYDDRERMAYNVYNKGLAEKFNARFKNACCPVHDHINCVLEIDMKRGKDIIKIVSYCCNEFKEKLDVIADLNDPFEKMKSNTCFY
jgi:D-lyxose ketol-isomerase